PDEVLRPRGHTGRGNRVITWSGELASVRPDGVMGFIHHLTTQGEGALNLVTKSQAQRAGVIEAQEFCLVVLQRAGAELTRVASPVEWSDLRPPPIREIEAEGDLVGESVRRIVARRHACDESP